MTMNDKQKAFCAEYIIDFNGTQAAIRAGYSPRTANEQAAQLLAKLSIQNEISRLMDDRSKRTEVTQDRVLLEIARLAFNDPRKAFDETGNLKHVKDWPDEVAAAISSIKITEITQNDGPETYLKEVKFWDKGRQLELAGRHLGIFNDKLMIQGDKNKPLVVKSLTDEELEQIITGANSGS
jgi:phage terminase small subunit